MIAQYQSQSVIELILLYQNTKKLLIPNLQGKNVTQREHKSSNYAQNVLKNHQFSSLSEQSLQKNPWVSPQSKGEEIFSYLSHLYLFWSNFACMQVLEALNANALKVYSLLKTQNQINEFKLKDLEQYREEYATIKALISMQRSRESYNITYQSNTKSALIFKTHTLITNSQNRQSRSNRTLL
ncbi:hypothetical protein FGO68_gene13566 [Halteria grandinella]|uniref:Uncharacterized protein n=1 Tax=Halteria grandinella TaxID=5974 RepID=A0A8J8NFU6_HALGN|nr:hypothetical protein FGO68_gene13566 [Halteria grandinella]